MMPERVSNVLLITIDSLRHEYWEMLDVMDGDSTRFTQAVACGPSTPSSFPAILTGTQPLLYGGYEYLDETRPFLARTLADAGVSTVGFHSNPHLGANRNYDTGFQVFNDSAEGSNAIATLKDKVERRLDPDSTVYSVLRRIWHRFSMATDSSAYAKAGTISDNALEWLDTDWDRESPFFMWLHYMDVHYPFIPPSRFLESEGNSFSDGRVATLNRLMQEAPEELDDEDISDLLALYRGEIRFTNHHIGRILDRLKELGAFDETAIVVTADHGEAFGEHGRFGHHPCPYDELVRVPLFIRVPGGKDQTVDDQVSLVDLPRTVCTLLDIEPPKRMQGRSLVPALNGTTLSEELALSTGGHGDFLSCRSTNWKCLWRVPEDSVELYDLRGDPEEVDDVSESNPEVVSRFRERMEAYLSTAESNDVSLPDVDDSADVEQRLRDLGYVD